MGRSGEAEQLARGQIVELLPRLRRFALGLTGAPADADDLVQMAVERAIGRLDQWTVGTRLDSWLFRIVQNLHRNARRDAANQARILGALAPTVIRVEDGVATAHGFATAGRVWDAVMALPAEQRVVVIMVCVEGMSYRETAEVLDVPMGTVTSRLARGRAAISRALEEDLAPVGAAVGHERKGGQ